MQDKEKQKIEEETHKMPVAAYETQFTPAQIRHLAEGLAKIRYSNYGSFRQNLKKTKADEDYVFKSPEIVGARLIAEKARKKALPKIDKINPVIAEKRKDLFFEATA